MSITLYHYAWESGYNIYFLMHSLPSKIFLSFFFCFFHLPHWSISPLYLNVFIHHIFWSFCGSTDLGWRELPELSSSLSESKTLLFWLRLCWFTQNQIQNNFLFRLYPSIGCFIDLQGEQVSSLNSSAGCPCFSLMNILSAIISSYWLLISIA